MKKKIFMGLVSLLLVCSLILPVVPVSAGTSAAKKALQKKADELALEMMKKEIIANFSFYDINKDKDVELFFKPYGEDWENYTLKIYGYGNKKVSHVKTLEHVYDVRHIKKNLLLRTRKNRVTSLITYTYKNKKLTIKERYQYNAKTKTYYKGGKKIKKSAYKKYYNWFLLQERLEIKETSKKAISWVEERSWLEDILYHQTWDKVMWYEKDVAQLKVSLYSYDEKGQPILEDSISCPRNEPIPRPNIGKFNVRKLALLDTEKYDSCRGVTKGDITTCYYKTILEPSDVSRILPGYTLPEGSSASDYEVTGEYINRMEYPFYVMNQVDFYIAKKGEKPVRFATYRFEDVLYEGFELPQTYSADGYEYPEPAVHWNKNADVENGLDLTWAAVPGAKRYIIRYATGVSDDYSWNTYKIEITTEPKLSLMAEKGKNFYLEVWAVVEREGKDYRFGVLEEETREYENLFDK